MRSLACVVALLAFVASSSISGCMPDDSDPTYPVVPIGGSPSSGTIAGDNSGGGLEPNVPTGDAGVGDGGITTTDGSVVQDAGAFLDAFDFPMDAAPNDPDGDQIP